MKTVRPIHVSEPDLSDLERSYLLDAFDSTWISSTGEYVRDFEREFAKLSSTEFAISCCNGTAALHLAYLGLGLGPGDEVIVPDLTYVATANALLYVGAKPVFADCDAETWNVCPESVRRMITPRTRAIVAVHFLGTPCDLVVLRTIADQHGVALIEDAAEAHGSSFADRRVGSWGTVSTFSFYGNKSITTGEGGMVCTSDPAFAARVRMLRGQAAQADRPYWFDEVGYNYRLTNLACAMGLAQVERFEELKAKRIQVRGWYQRAIQDAELPITLQEAPVGADVVPWMVGVVLSDDSPVGRDELMRRLASEGIETRPFFHPLHELPMYRRAKTDDGCPASAQVGARGLMLPTHTKLSESDVRRIVDCVGRQIRNPTPTTMVVGR